jgi:hypothetical protein
VLLRRQTLAAIRAIVEAGLAGDPTSRRDDETARGRR